MGTDVQNKRFSQSDYALFAERLEDNLQALYQLLERPGFGVGKPRLALNWNSASSALMVKHSGLTNSFWISPMIRS